MAKLGDMQIYFNSAEYRPCYANGKKALFHRWSAKSEIVEPSAMIGGHNGGVLFWTVAIVEYQDGTVGEVLPTDIRFCDNKLLEQRDGKCEE